MFEQLKWLFFDIGSTLVDEQSMNSLPTGIVSGISPCKRVFPRNT